MPLHVKPVWQSAFASHVATVHLPAEHVPLGQSEFTVQPHLPSVAPEQLPAPIVEHSAFVKQLHFLRVVPLHVAPPGQSAVARHPLHVPATHFSVPAQSELTVQDLVHLPSVALPHVLPAPSAVQSDPL